MSAAQTHRISVIGLGKLGAPLAAVMARGGYSVIGVDVNPAYVEAINEGRAPVIEPRLQEFITASGNHLRATLDMEGAVLESDVSFVIVPTPSGPDHYFSNDYLVTALEAIGRAVRKKDGYHMVVITSTVMPGSTGSILRETLENSSGRTLGDSLGLCYSPEFIALGNVINDMLKPDFILLGESDAKAGDILASIYKRVCENEPPVRRMNFVNAELCKISINTFVTTKISYANMLAEMCDKLDGADVDIVSNAVGSDSRIGTKYLRGGIAYGGPCFPRDNRAFAALAANLGTASQIAKATDDVNQHQTNRLVDAVERHTAAGGTVCVLGLSYKPDTDVIEQSPGIALALRLAEKGFSVVAHDPIAGPNARKTMNGSVRVFDDLLPALKTADTVIITTPWPLYRDLTTSLLGTEEKMTVIDPWRVLKGAGEAVKQVVSLGRNPGA